MARRGAQAFRSHEHEDMDKIPDCFLCPDLAQSSRNEDNTSGTDKERPPLHWALLQSRHQGQRPFRATNLEMLSISSRRKSFGKLDAEGETKMERGLEEARASPGARTTAPPIEGSCASVEVLWLGPCRETMSVAGFYRLSPDRARCSYCDLQLRKLQASDDVWMRHKQLSPCCRRLRQICDAGIRQTAKGKRRLRHSFSSYYDLTR